MKSWNQLLIRHGWLLKQVEENVFDCTHETQLNMEFLLESLDKANIDFMFDNRVLILPERRLSEQTWITAFSFENRGRSGFWFRPGVDEPKLHELDVYISGIVRQLNRLGFYTQGSCDGHGKRPAHVMLTKGRDINELVEILLAAGMKRVHWRERSNSYHLTLHMQEMELLDLAEKLSLIEKSGLGKGMEYHKEKFFQHLLEELLSIPGVSGEEEIIRDVVKKKLSPHVDYLTVDHAGNILAEKTYKNGNGPTILLNAHLDTVADFAVNRQIMKDRSLWTSSRGILGADDRAGVAVVLQLAEYLNQTSTFNGKVKFIFTVEEECGLIGANSVHEYFLWGIDAAIVVDRRGKGDIVTSCGGYMPFCDASYGAFFEEVATTEGLQGWATTHGGSSDTRIWAEYGIQSVNLSVGYQNEHTEREVLDVDACYETVGLLEGVFKMGRELRKVVREIKQKDLVANC
ncbi:M20/M25/M40 family metallo-hydrolase [Aquibacillus rhizosphaerae]|uniref:M20/M25/M40 family metallo-hydrolase n=1 Tax=Aquibacillus rhizosphaerae TaxID=3051431 RepID=A0ABT7L9E5_9BACI|nr:M20/M25/M40 family metallo-hydrolase [Aquibacillus sp. LR5S19]MDL4842490.1 M20/M25/M40 family metallo-hydrolase [Aquibacillus sp. LR5S19]